MKKELTTDEKVRTLTDAIWRADGKLEWILNPAGNRKASEWAMTTAKHVRGILQSALKKVQAPSPSKSATSSADKKMR
jgi:hypothetical protein